MPGETSNAKFNQPTDGIAAGSSTPADRNLSLVQVTAAIVLVLSVSLSLYQLVHGRDCGLDGPDSTLHSSGCDPVADVSVKTAV